MRPKFFMTALLSLPALIGMVQAADISVNPNHGTLGYSFRSNNPTAWVQQSCFGIGEAAPQRQFAAGNFSFTTEIDNNYRYDHNVTGGKARLATGTANYVDANYALQRDFTNSAGSSRFVMEVQYRDHSQVLTQPLPLSPTNEDRYYRHNILANCAANDRLTMGTHVMNQIDMGASLRIEYIVDWKSQNNRSSLVADASAGGVLSVGFGNSEVDSDSIAAAKIKISSRGADRHVLAPLMDSVSRYLVTIGSGPDTMGCQLDVSGCEQFLAEAYSFILNDYLPALAASQEFSAIAATATPWDNLNQVIINSTGERQFYVESAAGLTAKQTADYLLMADHLHDRAYLYAELLRNINSGSSGLVNVPGLFSSRMRTIAVDLAPNNCNSAHSLVVNPTSQDYATDYQNCSAALDRLETRERILRDFWRDFM